MIGLALVLLHLIHPRLNSSSTWPNSLGASAAENGLGDAIRCTKQLTSDEQASDTAVGVLLPETLRLFDTVSFREAPRWHHWCCPQCMSSHVTFSAGARALTVAPSITVLHIVFKRHRSMGSVLSLCLILF